MDINGVIILDHERVDDLQRGGLRIIQDPARFCFGIDAVLLAGFVKLRSTDYVLDIGSGTGVIPLLLAARFEAPRFEGLEIQAESADMAARSVALNALGHRIGITCGDIRSSGSYYRPAFFDVITTNPPYVKAGEGILSGCEAMAIARHEISCTLDDTVSGAARLLKPGGRLFMVHRPKRLADIISSLRDHGLGARTLRFVVPRCGKSPSMLLVEAIRGASPELRIMPELAVYNADGTYTDEVFRIYND